MITITNYAGLMTPPPTPCVGAARGSRATISARGPAMLKVKPQCRVHSYKGTAAGVLENVKEVLDNADDDAEVTCTLTFAPARTALAQRVASAEAEKMRERVASARGRITEAEKDSMRANAEKEKARRGQSAGQWVGEPIVG